MTVHQISVFLENRAGQLSEITQVLADNAIDMRAISIAETADYGVLRLIVDQPQKATTLLLEHGFILSMTPVTVVAVPDQPGGLAPVLKLLAEANIDIEYMYSLFTHTDGKAYMVFRVSDDEGFAATLTAHGISPVGTEEQGIQKQPRAIQFWMAVYPVGGALRRARNSHRTCRAACPHAAASARPLTRHGSMRTSTPTH